MSLRIITPVDKELNKNLVLMLTRYMKDELALYPDLYFDGCDVNATKLAEAAADHLNAYVDEDSYEVHDDIFELAMHVGEAWVKSKLGDEKSPNLALPFRL